MTTIYLVRHGNTFSPGELPRRIGARTDLPLVDSGRAQGEALGRHFAAAGIHFSRALVSPLRRTQETAALILHGQQDAPRPEAVPWLTEIDHGPDENADDETIVARIGAEALAAWDRDAIAPPGWNVDVAMRIGAWRTLYADLKAGSSDNLLIVTSNGSARFALMAQSDLLAETAALPSLKIRTGAWGILDVDPAATARLREWDMRPA